MINLASKKPILLGIPLTTAAVESFLTSFSKFFRRIFKMLNTTENPTIRRQLIIVIDTFTLIIILNFFLSPYNAISILYLQVAFSAYLGGVRSALNSAALIWLFASIVLSDPNQPFTYSGHGLSDLFNMGATLGATAVGAGLLKHRSNLLVQERLQLKELELINQQIQLHEREYKMLFFRNPNPMCIYDPQTLKFLAVNNAALQHYGYSEAEFLSMKITDIQSSSDNKKLLDHIKNDKKVKIKHTSSIVPSGTWKHLKKDGSIIFVETTTSQVNFGNKPAVLILLNDITEKRKLEDMKDALLSITAHELKTPISTLKLLVESRIKKYQSTLMVSNVDDFKAINTELDYLTSLINDMLDMRRIESGAMELSLTEININKVIAEVIGQMRLITGNREIHFKGKRPFWVYADTNRIRQVLINLLSNAAKYSSFNSKIAIFLHRQGEFIRVAIQDRGEGIPKSSISHIFERFYQVRPNNPNSFGIGLYISKEIITRHNGKIWVESTLGRGSTFYFTLMSSDRKN